MPKRRQRQRRTAPSRQKNKATLSSWLRWLFSELHNELRKAIVGTLVTVIVAVVKPVFIDSSWGTSPVATTVQFYQI